MTDPSPETQETLFLAEGNETIDANSTAFDELLGSVTGMSETVRGMFKDAEHEGTRNAIVRLVPEAFAAFKTKAAAKIEALNAEENTPAESYVSAVVDAHMETLREMVHSSSAEELAEVTSTMAFKRFDVLRQAPLKHEDRIADPETYIDYHRHLWDQLITNESGHREWMNYDGYCDYVGIEEDRRYTATPAAPEVADEGDDKDADGAEEIADETVTDDPAESADESAKDEGDTPDEEAGTDEPPSVETAGATAATSPSGLPQEALAAFGKHLAENHKGILFLDQATGIVSYPHRGKDVAVPLTELPDLSTAALDQWKATIDQNARKAIIESGDFMAAIREMGHFMQSGGGAFDGLIFLVSFISTNYLGGALDGLLGGGTSEAAEIAEFNSVNALFSERFEFAGSDVQLLTNNVHMVHLARFVQEFQKGDSADFSSLDIPEDELRVLQNIRGKKPNEFAQFMSELWAAYEGDLTEYTDDPETYLSNATLSLNKFLTGKMSDGKLNWTTA